jgi:hypothetical protein
MQSSDSAYPCYSHECYESGNFHISCPRCPFYKTVISEFNRKAENHTDSDEKERILAEIVSRSTQEESSETIDSDSSEENSTMENTTESIEENNTNE